MTLTTHSMASFKNNCLLKLLYLLILFIGRCQADQGSSPLTPISITAAVTLTLAASIMVTLICACLQTQCACCQSLGRQYHRIPSTADYPMNNRNPHRKYYYGSDQIYLAQKNIELYTLSNTGPPPAQIDHKEPNTSLSSTVAYPSVSAPTGDSQIVTQIL